MKHTMEPRDFKNNAEKWMEEKKNFVALFLKRDVFRKAKCNKDEY
jgi:hypothetical protein